MEDRKIIENEESVECEIVKEVREIRHKISARFDHDVGRLVAHYQEMQEQMRQSGKYRFAELPNEDLKISESIDTETKETPMLNYLTKSKYLNGLQCHKRLWYEENYPGRAADDSRSQQRRLDESKKVGILARDYFPDGVLIDAIDPLVAVEQTKAAIERGNTCIFEASFIFNDVFVRCDVLQKDSNSWRIIEVKASTVNRTFDGSEIIKKEYLHDLAIQNYVLTGYGLSVSKIQLMLINSKECVYPDLSNLFSIKDATDQVDSLMNDVDNNVETFKTILDRNDEPPVLIGDHCNKPYTCPFKETHCWKSVPKKSIFTISRLHPNKKNELIKNGILSICDLPTDFSLTPPQRIYVNSILHKEPAIDTEAIQQELTNLQYPIHFLDFETDNPPIPIFGGLRPYQHFPFQYSCHIMQSDGSVTHHEYLHTDTSDPRKPLLESLLNHVSTNGSVVVYKASFEKGVLKDLADAFCKHASTLQSIIDRLWDQLVIFQKHYMHPGFLNSNSLKAVLPILVPSLRYENLDVQEGTEAQAVWNLMLNTTNEENKSDMIKDLKAYCKMDTLATLEIHKILCEL